MNGTGDGRGANIDIWLKKRWDEERRKRDAERQANIDRFPELHDLRFEQVEKLLGTFHTATCEAVNASGTNANWFVPYASPLPVMVRRKGGKWWPRGF